MDLRDIRVLARRKLGAAGDQCYAAPQSSHGLRHLEADVAASQDDQVPGEALQVEHLDMSHGLRIL